MASRPSSADPARALDLRLAEAEAALAREMRVSKALREVGTALGTTLDLDQLLELILDKITEALEADRATLYLLDDANDELVSRIALGDDVRSIRLKVGHGIAGHVARTGKPLHVRDAYKDPRFLPDWDLLLGYRTRSILAAPMKNHLGRTIGVVQVLNKKRGDFTEDDADILAALVHAGGREHRQLAPVHVGHAEEHPAPRHQGAARAPRPRSEALFDLERAMARAASLEELFMAVLGEAMRACEARMGAVALRDPEERTGAMYLIDERARKMKRVPFPDDVGLIGWAIREQRGPGHQRRRGRPAARRGLRRAGRRRRRRRRRSWSRSRATAARPWAPSPSTTSAEGVPSPTRTARSSSCIAANASTAIRLQLSREAREREERLTTIGRLLSSVIHDLKTPLTVISGYVQLMQNSDDHAQREKYAEHVLRQFDHIGAMQREVLEFARGEKSVLVRKVYLQKFFEDVRDQLEGDLARRGIELVLDVQERGTARFDESKILRVVHNLARNAAEAMGPGGGKLIIKVTRDKADGALVISFSDNGPGIPKEIEHRLFQSFVTSGKKGGTGLGLAIVKKIAEEHGGTITVQSSSRGATFRLRLPQAAP